MPRLELMDYAIFRIGQPDEPSGINMKPLIMGSLIADDDKTLNYLLNTGISRKYGQEGQAASASAGSESEIPRVERELRMSLRLAG